MSTSPKLSSSCDSRVQGIIFSVVVYLVCLTSDLWSIDFHDFECRPYTAVLGWWRMKKETRVPQVVVSKLNKYYPRIPRNLLYRFYTYWWCSMRRTVPPAVLADDWVVVVGAASLILLVRRLICLCMVPLSTPTSHTNAHYQGLCEGCSFVSVDQLASLHECRSEGHIPKLVRFCMIYPIVCGVESNSGISVQWLQTVH